MHAGIDLMRQDILASSFNAAPELADLALLQLLGRGTCVQWVQHS